MTSARKPWKKSEGHHEYGGWVVDDGMIAGPPVVLLNPSETNLMARLMAARGRVVTYAALAEVLAPGKSHKQAIATLRTVTKNLRKKIGRNCIATVSRRAYRLLPRESRTPVVDDLITHLSAALSAARNLKTQLEEGRSPK